MDVKKIEAKAEDAVALLKALSNACRLRIMCALYEGEKNVGELETVIGLSQSAISQHLARLRQDGLVKTRREAQTIYYSMEGNNTRAILETLHDLYCDSLEGCEH